MLLREFTFTVKDNKYQVKIPNPGQLIQIETEKALVTNGIYRQIMLSSTVGATYALDVVDMHSYFSVLVPNLLKDMKGAGTSLLEMDLMDFNELRNSYLEKFVPWVISWQEMLSAPPKEIEDSTPENSKESLSEDEKTGAE